MSDPFNTLRAELVSAAARAELTSSGRRWPWLRGRTRPVAVVIAALVVCGSAAAATISLTASSSQPLSGRVPGRVSSASPRSSISLAGYRYSIRVTPSLASGSSGWAVWTAYQGPGFGSGLGGGGGGGYPALTEPIFQGDSVAPWTFPVQSQGDSVGFVVTGPQVVAVRIGDRTIRTFASSQLPVGDRVAVFFVKAHAPVPLVGWRPGKPINSRMRVPENGPRSRWVSIPTTAVLPLDSAGHTLPTASLGPGDGYVRGWSFWQAPSAITPRIHEPPYHGPTRPRAGACGLAQRGLPGLTAEWGSTITTIPAVKHYVGELFVSCVSTEYYLHGWPLTAAVLLDAGHPGATLGPIPGAAAVPGHPGVVDFAGASLSAKRVANAWLLVQGGSGTTQRLRVLKALRITELDLHAAAP
jgi:hypothetical protein